MDSPAIIFKQGSGSLIDLANSNPGNEIEEAEIIKINMGNRARDDSIILFPGLLGIRLVLNDSIFTKSPGKIDMKIINNSNFIVLTRGAYVIKHFELGFWAALPEFEKLIWTDEGIVVEPETERTFVAELDLLGINLVQGRYKIEKVISLFEKEEGPGIKSNSPVFWIH